MGPSVISWTKYKNLDANSVDNTFNYILFIPSNGAEIRIIGNKNGKKVKELIFKVKVGK